MMGMAPFPTLWQHLKCGTYITVNADTGRNIRAPNGFVEIWCSACKQWTNPCDPNGHA